MYHRFEENKYPSTNIKMNDFKNHLKIIKGNKIKFVNPKKFEEELINNKKQRKVLLTIDDGFSSFYDNASSKNLSHGLIAFYRFNGNTNDETSYKSNGTVSGATLTSGKANISNTAYSFDGRNDKITIANNPLFNFSISDNLSFSIWIYPKTFGNLKGVCRLLFMMEVLEFFRLM